MRKSKYMYISVLEAGTWLVGALWLMSYVLSGSQTFRSHSVSTIVDPTFITVS